MKYFLFLLSVPLVSGFAVIPFFGSATLPSTTLFLETKFGVVTRELNWMERTAPLGTDSQDLEEYNLGLSGIHWDVGPQSLKIYESMKQSSAHLEMAGAATTNMILRSLKMYALEFAAKEAVKVALCQNGLKLVKREDEEDTGRWADVSYIQLLDEETEEPIGQTYDSFEDVVDDWTPGQPFAFVAKNVPAKKI